jgi:diguanylate cyclase (GGDEF)-like protein
MKKRDHKTVEVNRADVESRLSEPPTAVTNVADIRALLRGDRWTLTVLTGEQSGRVVELTEKANVIIGRGSDAEVRQIDESLSRRHAAFTVHNGEPRVEDLSSTNGTFVDGARLEGARVLHNGARVQLGLNTAVRVQLQTRHEISTATALYESSIKDPLTGVSNRRHLDEQLDTELGFAKRHRTPLSVLMLDIDHFKKVNDTFGHPAGDAVLQAFSGLLTTSVRREDLVGRYGGEEFIILLRDSTASAAQILAERIRGHVETLAVPWEEKTIRFTVSIGIATHDTTTPFVDGTSLVAAADDCLYRAKRAGRNLVVGSTSARSVPPRG